MNTENHHMYVCHLEILILSKIDTLERSNMDEKLRTMIQEEFAICVSLEEVCVTYKDLSIEIEKQMRFMISQLSKEN